MSGKEFIVELIEERSAFVRVVADGEAIAREYAYEACNNGTIRPGAFSQRNHFEGRVVSAEDLAEEYGLDPDEAVTCSLVDMFPLKERLAKELFDYLHDMQGIAEHEDVVEAARAAIAAFSAGRANWEDGPGIDRVTTSIFHSKFAEVNNFKPKMGM